MAAFHGLAGKIRGIVESDEFDLGSIKEPFAAAQLVSSAFGTPLDAARSPDFVAPSRRSFFVRGVKRARS